MLLYHGTSKARALQILQCGLMPRSITKLNNWDHTVKSNEEAVYLSNAYPLYFALQATESKEQMAVLEIDTTKLREHRLVADEDAVEQAMRGHDQLPKTWSMEKRTAFYRDRIDQYKYEHSLQALGSCAHLGMIDPEAITRVAYVDFSAYVNMVRHGYDPTVSVMAFRAVGSGYQKSTKWLFDPESVEQEYVELGGGHRHPLIPIMDDRTGIHVEQVAV